MENSESKFKKLQSDITKIIDKALKENSALFHINIGTHGGTLLASVSRKDLKLTVREITSASTSLLFLSSKMLTNSLNQEISHNLITGKDIFLLSILTENITLISYFERELAELEGLAHHINKLKKLALQITAIVDTSELMREEIFVAIKRAIPNTLVLAIISKEGLPIRIQSTMAEPMISAIISAIFTLSEVLLKGQLDYSIIFGENGSIILHELDEQRILCIAVPEADDAKLKVYIAKIKKLIAKRNRINVRE